MTEGREQSQSWPFPLLRTSEDKSSSRMSVQQGHSHEIAGVDGAVHGGLRPFTGMQLAHELDFQSDLNHDETSVVLDTFPVDFRISDSGYGYGFVYRVQRLNGGGSSDVFIDYYNSITSAWQKGILLLAGVSNTDEMAVAFTGRFVFILIAGRGAASFFIVDEDEIFPGEASSLKGTGTWRILIVGDDPSGPFPGPGKRPFLIDTEDAGALGSLTPAAVGHVARPGAGQVVLTQLIPSETGLFPARAFTSSSGEDEDVPELDDEVEYVEPGGFNYAYQLYDSRTGRRSGLSKEATSNYVEFDEEDTSSSSGAGRAGGSYIALEVVYDSNKFDYMIVYRTTDLEEIPGRRGPFHTDRIIDLSDWHTIHNGPGKRFDPSVTDLRQAIYWYSLDTKVLAQQARWGDHRLYDEEVPRGGAAIAFENTLIVSNIPHRGVSTTASITEFDAERGLGELRWSSLVWSSYELFSPQNRYTPKVPSNQAIAWRQVGPNVIGFSLDRLYHVRQETIYIKVSEVHTGFGITNRKALDVVGSRIYYMTSKGLKAIDERAALDDIQAFDSLMIRDWVGDLRSVSVAHDPEAGAVYVLNPVKESVAVLWFSSGMATEWHDMPFDEVSRGVWPVENGDWSGPLTERAFFLQNSPKDAAGEVITGWKPRLYIFDYQRTKTISGSRSDDGSPRLSTLDPTGDLVFPVAGIASSSSSSGGVGDTLVLDTTNQDVGTRLEGAECYILGATDEELIGNSATIKEVSGDTLIFKEGEGGAAGMNELVAGDVVALSPPKVRWVSGQLQPTTEEGFQFMTLDLFRVRQVDGIAPLFVDVVKPASFANTTWAKYKGLVFEGSDDDPKDWAFVRNLEGGLRESIIGDDPTLYAAFGADREGIYGGRYGVTSTHVVGGIEVMVPDVDFRLLTVLVEGKILSARRTRRASDA